MINSVQECIIWQCAWCRCLMLNGRKVKESEKLLKVSHGICLKCKEAMLR